MVGWRWWLLQPGPDGAPGTLLSPFYRVPWTDGTPEALCWASRRPRAPRLVGWVRGCTQTPPAPGSGPDPGVVREPDPDHPVPHVAGDNTLCGATCGIHVARRRVTLARWRWRLSARSGLVVFGTAECWGRVVEHSLGWRVAAARVRGLVAPVRPTDRLAAAVGADPGLVRVLADTVRATADALGVEVISPSAAPGTLRDAWEVTVRSVFPRTTLRDAPDPDTTG